MAKVLIIGAARSGLAAAAILAQKGEEVVVTATNIKAQSESEEALKNGIESVVGYFGGGS